MALKREHRLSLRFNRDRLTKTGKSYFGNFFTLIVSKKLDSENKFSRFAILLSKKTAPLASDRNKIKRITSAIIEGLLSQISLHDYLIIPKSQVIRENNNNLVKDLKNLFNKQ